MIYKFPCLERESQIGMYDKPDTETDDSEKLKQGSMMMEDIIRGWG